MESLSLTIPIAPPAITDYRVVLLRLDWTDAPLLEVTLRGTTGELRTHAWTGAPAGLLIRQLNTANLSVKSLHRRILERLVADGVLAGTPTGTPD